MPLLMNLELRLVGAIPFMHLSGSLSKSGKRNFGTKNNFPSFFVSEKGLAHIYNKAIYFFSSCLFLLCYEPKLHFAILAELRLPTVIRKVTFADFLKRATSNQSAAARISFSYKL